MASGTFLALNVSLTEFLLLASGIPVPKLSLSTFAKDKFIWDVSYILRISISALLCKPYRLLYEQGMSRVTATSDPGSVLKGFSLQKLCRIINIVARHPAHQTSRAVLLYGFQRFLNAPVRNNVSAHFYLIMIARNSCEPVDHSKPTTKSADSQIILL